MNLTVLGSGSRGNAIAVWQPGAAVLVDAGFGARTLRRRLKRACIDPATVRAIVLTHEHGDHARGASTLARALGCPVFASPGTLRVMNDELGELETAPLPSGGVDVGPFSIEACRTPHDATEPIALAIRDRAASRRFGIAHDLGHQTPDLERFLSGCTGIVLEANHDDSMLASGPYSRSLQARIAGRLGHLSNASAARFAATLYHTGLEFVVLAHLSQQCNRPDLARHAVAQALARRGFRGQLLVAEQDAPLRVVLPNGETQYRLPLN